MSGWIKLHRQFTEWEWYGDISTRITFLHILLSVNHVEKKWRGKTILPGQYITSLSGLAENIGISVRSVRTALNHLKSTNEITIETTNNYTIITVTKWESYQGERQAERQTDDKRSTIKRQQLKNDNNITNITNVISVIPATEKNGRGAFVTSDLSEMFEWFSQNAPSVDPTALRQKILDWCDAKGKTYKNYFAAMRTWATKEQAEFNNGGKNGSSGTHGGRQPLTGHAALAAIGKAARAAMEREGSSRDGAGVPEQYHVERTGMLGDYP